MKKHLSLTLVLALLSAAFAANAICANSANSTAPSLILAAAGATDVTYEGPQNAIVTDAASLLGNVSVYIARAESTSEDAKINYEGSTREGKTIAKNSSEDLLIATTSTWTNTASAAQHLTAATTSTATAASLNPPTGAYGGVIAFGVGLSPANVFAMTTAAAPFTG